MYSLAHSSSSQTGRALISSTIIYKSHAYIQYMLCFYGYYSSYEEMQLLDRLFRGNTNIEGFLQRGEEVNILSCWCSSSRL